MQKQKDQSPTYFIIWGLVIISISLSFPFVINAFNTDWEHWNRVGSAYNILSAVFSGLAFAGIIITILIQREELIEQRKELRLTREEFLSSRITNVIYKQLERFDVIVNSFSFYTPNFQKINGISALLHLSENFDSELYKLHNDLELDFILQKEPKEKRESIGSTSNLVSYITQHKEVLRDFSVSAISIIDVLKECLVNNDLDANEINSFKNLFFRNVGYDLLNSISTIRRVLEEFVELLYEQQSSERMYDINEEDILQFKAVYEDLGDFLSLSSLNFTEKSKNEMIENLRSELVKIYI